jgi:hypothetical protein
MIWAEYVAPLREMRNTYSILFVKPEIKRGDEDRGIILRWF